MTTAGAMTPLTGYLMRVNGGDTVARTIDAGNGLLIDVDARRSGDGAGSHRPRRLANESP